MTGFDDDQDPFRRQLPTEIFGELPYVHAAPRRVRPVGRRVAVATGSLAAGAIAAGAAAFAIVGSGEDPSVAVAAAGITPAATAEVTLDPSTRTEDVSRGDLRPGTCVRLDADALAAIEQARAAGADPAADGRTVTVQLAGGDVSVPVSSVKVVKCTVPRAASSAKTSSSAAKKPAATSTSTRPRATTTSRPAATTTKPRTTTTTTKPRTTTTTKPRTTTTTKTSTPTPKPTTSSAS